MSVRRALAGARRRGGAALAALRGALVTPAASTADAETSDIAILDWYSKEVPSAANAVGIFSGEWASRFPAPLEDVPAGAAPLFADPRISWCVERLAERGREGGVRGARVLELGPLEGGHSYMLERAGAASVTAIESNARSYLKCLIAKELLGLTRTSFAFGDFVPYLRDCADRFDVAVASGVIYHLLDPVRVIADLCSVTDSAIFVWTQYYDEDVIARRTDLHRKFGDRRTVEVDGHAYELVEYRYLDALDHAGFCGGSAPTSSWLTRDGLMAAFERHGFGEIEIQDDDREHVHGPAITFLARRTGEVASPR
jgi:hypothetical protein